MESFNKKCIFLLALILNSEIIQEKKELFSLPDYILSFSTVGLPKYCLLALVLQWFVKRWVWYPSDGLYQLGKSGVGIWVYHHILYLQYTSVCIHTACVYGSSGCLGVYYFTRECSTEQENHCNDEPMESGCQHLSNHPSLYCWKNFNHWQNRRHWTGSAVLSLNWWCHCGAMFGQPPHFHRTK